MKIPLQLTTRRVSLSETAVAAIRKKAAKLEALFDNLVSCRVMVEAPHRHKHQGLLYNVRIDLTMPGRELVVKREPHEDIYVAIRDAFDAARRQLLSFARRQRGDVKAHIGVPVAERVFADHGFGFHHSDDGRDVYFHGDGILGAELEHVRGRAHDAEEPGSEGSSARPASPV